MRRQQSTARWPAASTQMRKKNNRKTKPDEKENKDVKY
jgi:hypothetical protein